MNSLKPHIIQCLKYFSYFNHPLNSVEVHKFLGTPAKYNECISALNDLVQNKEIVTDGLYYALEQSHLIIRSENKELNTRLLKIGKRVGKFIGFFPFVRGVFISGSLSKMGANSHDYDIDYFIITEKNRLWTARMFLIVFKKIFLFNSKKYFCINFFKSTDDLHLIKKNKYIGIEAVSLIPIVNSNLLENLFKQNPWIKKELPNHDQYTCNLATPIKKIAWIEVILNGWIGNTLENLFFRLFKKHQKTKYKNHHYAEIVATKSTSALFPNSVEKDILVFLKK